MDDYGLIVTTTSNNGEAYQQIATTIGDLYVVTVRAYSPSSNTTSLDATLLVSNSSFSPYSTSNGRITATSTWQTLMVGFRATTATSWIELRDTTSVSGNVSYFDAITVQNVSTGGTYYIDPTVTYEGDGTSQSSASAIAGVGAYKDFKVVNGFTGDLGGMSILLKKGTSISSNLSLGSASNFTIGTYGSGARPIIDASSPFVHTWTQEGNLWYTPIDSGMAYYRAFIVNGTKLDIVTNKTDLDTGTNKSWYDSVNLRHYILLDGVVDPNSATIRANSKASDSFIPFNLSSCSDYSVSGIQVQYGHAHNIYAVGSGNNRTISDMVSIGAGGQGDGSSEGSDGIIVYGVSASSPATGVVIQNNTLNGNLNNGIEVWSLDGAVISGNTFDGNGGGIELWGYITNSTIKNNLIENSTLSSTSNMSPNGGRGIWGTSNAQQSPSTGNNGNNTIKNNIISNSYNLGIYIEQGTGWSLYNNTIYGILNNNGIAGSMALGVKGSGTAATLTNNIIGGSDGMGSTAYLGANSGDITLSGNNNIFYSFPSNSVSLLFNGTSYTGNFSGFKTATGQSSSINTNPTFIDASALNFNPQPLSPVLDVGTSVGLTTDYSGNPIYGTPDIGAYEHQPPYTFAANNIPTSGALRLYTDGRYRMTTATSSSAIGTFSVAPVGGAYTASTSAYMELSVTNWTASNKEWIATSTTGQFNTYATSTVYSIGDLDHSTYYTFTLDNVASTTAISDNSQCTSGICLSDGSGNLTFTYQGGYSTHTFDLTKDVTAPTTFSAATPTNLVLNAQPALSWTASSDSESGLSKYQLYIDGSLTTDNIASTTTSTSLPSNLSCNDSHTTYVRAVDKNNNATNSSTRSFSIPCGAIVFSASPVNITSTSLAPPATATNPSQPQASPEQITSSSNLSSEQISSILSLLSSFGVDTATIANVQAILSTGTATPHPFSFTRNLSLNQASADVKSLQQFLNTHDFTVAPTGPGSPGNETAFFGMRTYAALMRFQKSQGLPATGWFGPMTREKISRI
jgi:parallel beta-helix repeat protein